MSKLILIDGNALVHRAFHALPPTLTSTKGVMTNAVFGFTSILLRTIKDQKPDYIAATFDLAGPTIRHEQFADYKAHRVKAPQELYDQIPLVKQIVSALGIPIYEKQGYEADDVIGTIATQTKKTDNVKLVIMTGDLDTLQLVEGDKVVVSTLRKGMNDIVIYDEQAVMERYGLKPNQLVDYRGLKGDPSDNIPGVPGIGEKTATKLIQQHGTLEALFESKDIPEKIKAHKDAAFFSKQLSQIICDLDIGFSLDSAKWREHLDLKKLEELFNEFGFKSLAKRLAEIGLAGNLVVEPLSTQESLFPEEIRHIEEPLTPVLRDMERWGIKIDLAMLLKLKKTTRATLEELEKKIHKLAGVVFNVNSPQQLGEILYDRLDLQGKVRKTAGGARSTAAPELEKLRDEHPIIDLVLQYRELQKLLTTYIEPFPALIAKDGRIHTTYDQTGAATGRLSSNNPNLQNIPIRTELGQEFRKAFIAESGYELVSLDYSQIELRIVAHLAQDKKMIDAFRKGEDIHKQTATLIGITRRQAKVLNFGVLYGMGSMGVARAAGVSREEGRQFIEKYFAEFTGVAQYIEHLKKQAHELGYAETLFGRRRMIPEIRSTMPQLQAQGERMAVNMPSQGTAADLMKLAMVAIFEYLNIKKMTQDCRMLLQIHDELLFEIKKNLVAELAPKLKELMENVYKFDVPIVVDVKVGDNWQDMRKI